VINFTQMKLLISPKNLTEAEIAADGGADIIDIKNPTEGSLGANFPWVIKGIIKAIPGIEISATLGDLDNRPGFASLGARGLSSLGVNYVKGGLLVKNRGAGEEIGGAVVKSVAGRDCKVVLAGYGDNKTLGSITPGEVIEIACITGAHGVMIDTYHKNGTSLFDQMSFKEIKGFVDQAKDNGLLVALAGSIGKGHIPILKDLDPDIVGIRGAVCTENDRVMGAMDMEKVKEFKRLLME
jgi:uncharacterized protein (UPF0264 family)